MYFLAGGTQTNAVVISALLRSYEGVLAAETGHVNTHEAGAIEYTGHTVLTLPEHQGKLDVGAAVGQDGLLGVLRDFGSGQPYIGQVEIVSGETRFMTSKHQPSSMISVRKPSLEATSAFFSTQSCVTAA